MPGLLRRTLNGKTFLMYGYNGQYPGPLIKAERGATVIVELVNEIDDAGHGPYQAEPCAKYGF